METLLAIGAETLQDRTAPAPSLSRSALATARLPQALAALESCELCQHRCAANRRTVPAGRCGAGPEPRIFSAQVEAGDELEILPTYAIALAGCNMRCSFCITGDESWHPQRGQQIAVEALASHAAQALTSGRARTVQVLGGEPTLYLPWLLRLAAALPADAPLVLKTNGLLTATARTLLAGLYGTWIVDLKFGNDRCAAALSRTPGYLAAVGETLQWADRHADLIIRHLLLRGHLDCCWRPAAAWIATHLPTAKVSLRAGYWPAWQAARQAQAPLNRPLAAEEATAALAIARHHHLRLVP